MKKLNSFIWLVILLLFSTNISASVEVLGSLKHTLKGNPGDIIKGEIKIQNNDTTPQEVRIYQTDLLYNLDENTFYDEPESHKRSNAKWIQFSPKTVVLKAKEVRSIQYEITIPSVDSIKGTYWSVLMVEGVAPIDPNKTGDMSIRTVTRYAVQMITEMNNKGTGVLKFLEPTLVKDLDKKLFLAVDLTNTGDHYISPEVSVELFDEQGESIGILTAPKKGLFPTTSARFKINLDGVPSGKTYKAMIVAAGLDEDVFGLEYTLYF